MDFIITLILIILFIVILIFLLALGMLTRLIRKRDIGIVLLIGIVLGGVGGLFFVTPISEDIPQFVGACTGVIYGDSETLVVELTTEANVQSDINAMYQIGGVKNITNTGLVIHTTPFDNTTTKYLNANIEYLYPNITTWELDGKNGEIHLNLSDNNYERAISVLKGPLYDNYNISYSYGVMELEISAEANAVDHIVDQLNTHHVVVTKIEGPVHDIINTTSQNMPSNQNIILICAGIGALFVIFGIFIDQIRRGLSRFRRTEKYKKTKK